MYSMYNDGLVFHESWKNYYAIQRIPMTLWLAYDKQRTIILVAISQIDLIMIKHNMMW